MIGPYRHIGGGVHSQPTRIDFASGVLSSRSRSFICPSSYSGGSAKCSQGAIIQFVDVVQLNVGWRTVRENLRVVRVVALPWEHRGDALTPHLLHRIEDSQLIIDHYIPLCRIKTLDLGKQRSAPAPDQAGS